MSMRAFNEAARALVVWTALTSDLHHRSEDEKTRQAADDHMKKLTRDRVVPIISANVS